jgi:hypothetical protein
MRNQQTRVAIAIPVKFFISFFFLVNKNSVKHLILYSYSRCLRDYN